MTDIKILKLMSGEEVLGECTFNDSTITVKNAVSIVYQQTEKGLGAGLAPFMPYCEDDIDINNHAVASSGVPNKDMLNQYNSIFSGIVVAGADEMPEMKIVK